MCRLLRALYEQGQHSLSLQRLLSCCKPLDRGGVQMDNHTVCMSPAGLQTAVMLCCTHASCCAQQCLAF
jgi:hypothetical protein